LDVGGRRGDFGGGDSEWDAATDPAARTGGARRAPKRFVALIELGGAFRFSAGIRKKARRSSPLALRRFWLS
jgi:hypothetical protein